MTRTVRISIVAILTVLFVTLAGLWFASDRLLDQVVRPWLTEQVAAALDAEVRTAHLSYADGRLLLTGVKLARAGTFELDVAEIEMQFSWFGLLQRRISELVIRQPRLVWMAAAEEPATEADGWPQDPPLQIDVWRLEDGRAELHWSGQRFVLEQLAAEGALGREFPFAATARGGAPPGVPLGLGGKGIWRDGFTLILDWLLWDDNNLLSQTLHVSPGADRAFAVQLSLPRLDDSQVAGLLATFDQPPPWPVELAWTMQEPTIDLSLQGGDLAAELKTAAGSISAAGRNWSWLGSEMRFQGNAEHLAYVINAELPGSGTLHVDGSWADRRLTGQLAAAVANPSVMIADAGLQLPAGPWQPSDLTLSGSFEAGGDSARFSAVKLTAGLAGLGRLEGELDGEWHEGRLELASDRLILFALQGSGRLAEASLELAGDPARADFQGNWSLRVADAMRLAGSAGFPLPGGVPELRELVLQGDLLWRDDQLLLPGIDLTGRLAGAGASARLHGQLELAVQPGGDLSAALKKLSLDTIEYQSADGMAGLAGGRLVLAGRLDLADGRLGFKLAGQVGADEALLQSWYGRLADLPVKFSIQGNWWHAGGRLELARLDVDLAGLVNGHFAASHKGQISRLSGQVAVPRLQGDFQKRLQALAGELFPGLAGVAMAGRLLLDLSASRHGESRTLDLLLTAVDLAVARGENFRVEGLSGQLPGHLRFGPAREPAPETSASLRWSLLQAGLLKSADGQMTVVATPNRWRLQQPLELPAAGGHVNLTAMQFDLAELVPQLQASLEMIDIELPELSRLLGWPEMSGMLSARFEGIHISGDEISTTGAAALQVFGGNIAIANMRVDAPFSRFPIYHADVEFSAIDLYQLTNTFEFGEMNGVVDGYIRGLRLFDGSPSAFRARLETRPEGRRNISVKAVRNLNTLSQGGLSAALSHGIYRFIDFYRYRKIGLLCWLQNDVFHLEGTAREGSRQHLVYGGLLPPRIDVVVLSPTISFKEMVRRLQRIERAED